MTRRRCKLCMYCCWGVASCCEPSHSATLWLRWYNGIVAESSPCTRTRRRPIYSYIQGLLLASCDNVLALQPHAPWRRRVVSPAGRRFHSGFCCVLVWIECRWRVVSRMKTVLTTRSALYCGRSQLESLHWSVKRRIQVSCLSFSAWKFRPGSVKLGNVI